MQRLYRTSRDFDLAYLSHWSLEQQMAFLDMQFEMQYKGYHLQYPQAQWFIIEENSEAIGRFIIEYRPTEIGLIDICLLPPYRGRGYGYTLIKQLFTESVAQHLPIRLYVTPNNENACRLYKRLGFQIIDRTETQYHMEWHP